MSFTTLVFFQLVNIFNARAPRSSAFTRLFHNPWVWGAVLLSAALQIVVVHAPFLQAAFGTVPLGLNDWGFCMVVAATLLVVRETVILLTNSAKGRRV